MDEIKEYDTFDEMGLKAELLRGVYAYGFEKPSTIQKKGICQVMKKQDLIAQSQSGTGKTATFVIGLLQIVDGNIDDTQGIVLSPTRELSLQIYGVLNNLSRYMSITKHTCIGGTSVRSDIDEIIKKKQIIIGTPGRIYDMILRNVLTLDNLKVMVFDEADEILSRGFRDQVCFILRKIPDFTNILVFSATLHKDILDITSKFMVNPIQILLNDNELTLEGIKQYYIYVEKDTFKIDTLCDLYESLAISQTIIYCNTIRKVEWLSDNLRERDFPVSIIHGNLQYSERAKIMEEFRSGSSRILVTTDLLSRGIDIQQISLVINYDIPTKNESYIHRIGRSGRFGRRGSAINFSTERDMHILKDIEKYYSTVIEELPQNYSQIIS